MELGERRAFVTDFRRTAAATVLRLHCTISCAELLPHLVCVPQLVAIALRAVEGWTLDLAHYLSPAAHVEPHAASGGGNMLGGTEGNLCIEDVLDFTSDGIAAWQWAELLEYSYALADVADAAEVYQREAELTSIRDSRNRSNSALSGLHRAVDTFTACCAQNGAEPERKKNAPFASPGTSSFRMSIKPVTAPIANVRQLWADPVPFTNLILNSEPLCSSDRVETASTEDVPGHGVCSLALARLTALWPQAGIDGFTFAGELPRNVWIVKAPSASRGAGIELERRLNHILARSGGMGGRVAQKYIENPLLTDALMPPQLMSLQEAVPQQRVIPRPLTARRNGIKFDLRMWVLLVGASRRPGHTERDLPSECYVFEPCYARRCSHAFSLAATSFKDHLAHLSNYSVQKKDAASDDDTGAEDLLWTEEELLSAFGAEGSLNKIKWESRVKPSLRRLAATLAATVLPTWSDESHGGRAQCFELVGLDVMLDDHLNPWLLEANMTPGLSRRGDTNPVHCKRIEKMLNGIVHITTLRGLRDVSSPTSNDNLGKENRASNGWLKVYSAPMTTTSDNLESRDAQREAKTNADTLCVTGKQLNRTEMCVLEDFSKRRHGISTLANVGVPKILLRWRHKKMRLASAATSIQCFHRCLHALKHTHHLRCIRATCFIQQFARTTRARYFAKRELQNLRERKASVRIQSAWRRRLAQRHAKYCRLTRSWFASINKCQRRLAWVKWLGFVTRAAAATRAALTLQSRIRPYLQRCQFLAFVACERRRLREVKAANVIRTRFRVHRRIVLRTKLRINAANVLQHFYLGLPCAKRRQHQLRYDLTQKNRGAAKLLQSWWHQQTSKLRKVAKAKDVSSKSTPPFRLGEPVITTRSFASNVEADGKSSTPITLCSTARMPSDDGPKSAAKVFIVSPTYARCDSLPFQEALKNDKEFVPRAFGPRIQNQVSDESTTVDPEERATCEPQPAVILPRCGKAKQRKKGVTNHSESRLDKLAAPNIAAKESGRQSMRSASSEVSIHALEASRGGQRSGQHRRNTTSAPKSRRDKTTSAMPCGVKRVMVEGKSGPSNQSGFESVHSMLPQDIRELLSYARARRQQRAAATCASASLEARDTSRSEAGIEDNCIPNVGVAFEIPFPPPSPQPRKPLSGDCSWEQVVSDGIDLKAESSEPPPPHHETSGATEATKKELHSINDDENGDSGGSGATLTLDWLDQMQRRRKSGRKVRNSSHDAESTFLSRHNVTGGVLHSAAEQFLG